ncbi:MAG: hypothetical protein HY958_06850 [Bacteroidia bacterium]|nr:hypothetical protein [Bacteroidia bacterium]
MKTTVFLLSLCFALSCNAYTWHGLGANPVHVNALNICFSCGNYKDVICTTTGLCINDGANYDWVSYDYSLPVWEAIPYDTANILVVMGNGSFSDGIYKFNLTSHQFNVVEWIPNPTFIKFNPNNNRYYVGSRYNGLLTSTDGLNWDTVPYFVGKAAAAMDFYGNHIAVVQENNIFATYYSGDNGTSWNQSLSNIPIHDLAFDPNGKLYGVFTGLSNSSGLYSSTDFGATWDLETWSDNMETVGFDIIGNVFAGWHGAVPSEQGVGIYNTQNHSFSFFNTGLPNLNVHKFKVNPILSSITIFACTDTGVYYMNDYLTLLPELKSNPQEAFFVSSNFSDNTTTIFIQPDILHMDAEITIFDISGRKIKIISIRSDEICIDNSEFSKGVYLFALTDKKKYIFSTRVFL